MKAAVSPRLSSCDQLLYYHFQLTAANPCLHRVRMNLKVVITLSLHTKSFNSILKQ